MTAIGFGVAWAGYAIFMWGYCLVRDYNVTVPELFKATWPGVSTARGGVSGAAGPGSPTGRVRATGPRG